MKALITYLIFFLSACSNAFTQETVIRPVKTAQPKIIIVPKIKEGQEMKTLYDSDANIRVAMAKIGEALLNKEANLVSFDAKYKQAKEIIALNKGAGNQDDVKSLILQLSGADIYVETEVNVVRHQNLNANSVRIILEAYQNGTSNYLGVKTGSSRINRTEDIGLLTAQAMDTITISLLNMMQLKFDDIHENGQSIYVQFTTAPNAEINFDSEIGPQKRMLSELINEWFEKNSVNGVFNNQGVVSNMLIISDARIPLKNPSNKQLNYTGQNFYTDLNKFLKSLGIQAKREIGSNNKIIITIL